MIIKNLFSAWRRNVPLHATLLTREVKRIDDGNRDLVEMDNAEKTQLKFRGTTEDGIEVFVELELIGAPELLTQFRFCAGQHVGLILRAID